MSETPTSGAGLFGPQDIATLEAMLLGLDQAVTEFIAGKIDLARLARTQARIHVDMDKLTTASFASLVEASPAEGVH